MQDKPFFFYFCMTAELFNNAFEIESNIVFLQITSNNILKKAAIFRLYIGGEYKIDYKMNMTALVCNAPGGTPFHHLVHTSQLLCEQSA